MKQTEVLIRPPSVAGMFYPADFRQLENTVDHYLDTVIDLKPPPKAMIVPHAGYVYSGPVAASAYATLKSQKRITRVVLIGPDHRVGFQGLAAPTADFFATPLGNIPVELETVEKLEGVRQFDLAHEQEHSLEVQLPFLQKVLGEFSLIPLVTGQVEPERVAQVLRELWGGDETLIVISSDLSHYHSYSDARAIDGKTTRAIESMHDEIIGPNQACGFIGVRALLQIAQQKGLKEVTVDVRNSGDTAGSKNQVVGYGAYLFYA